MVCCACSLESRKRLSIAWALRDSSSKSVSHSKVWARLSSRLAASESTRSSCWLIMGSLSCPSFSCSFIGAVLSGREDKSVVFQQRQRISDQFIQQRITQPDGWLHNARA